MTLKEFDQIIIPTLGFISIYFISGKSCKQRFIGFTCTVLGQPFWFHATWTAGQMGMFLLSLWYTLNAVRGLIYAYREIRRTACADATHSQGHSVRNGKTREKA